MTDEGCELWGVGLQWRGFDSEGVAMGGGGGELCRGLEHRRRIELEDKAKVVASDWGQNPCRTSCFASVYLKQSVEFTEL